MHAYKHCLAHYHHHHPPHASPHPPPHPTPHRPPPARRQFLTVRVVNAYCVSHWHHFRLQRSTRLQSAQLLLFHSLVSLHFGVERKCQWKKFDCLVWLVGWTRLTPICLRRGSGGDRKTRGGGGGEVGGEAREGDYNLTLLCYRQTDSCISMGSNDSHFDVFINCEGKNHEELINHKSETERGPECSCRINTQGR